MSRTGERAESRPGPAEGMILVGALLVVLGFPAGGQTFGRQVEPIPAISALATSPASSERPALAAIDGRESTSWGAPEGATSAGAIIALSEPRLIAGLRVSARFSADSRLTVEWLDSSEHKLFFGGTLSGPFDGERVLDLTLERVVTDRLLITICGPSVSLDDVAELMPLAFAGPPARRYLPPDDVVPGEGASATFAAEWLADGDVRTSWRVGSLETESLAEMITELGEGGADVFRIAARKAAGMSLTKAGGTVGKLHPERLHPTGAIFEYRDPVSVDRVKLYFTRGTRGNADVQVETSAGWQVIASVPAETDFEGWVECEVSSPASGTRFKVVVDNAGSDAGDVTEMELWGSSPDRLPSIIQGEHIAPSSDGDALLRLLPLERRPYRIELFAAGLPRGQITGHLNGQPVILSRVSDLDGLALYQGAINAADFDADELWLSIPEADSLELQSCRLRAFDRSGEFFVAAGATVADGSLLRFEGEPGMRQWRLDRRLTIDAIEVRGPAAASSMARVLVEGLWVSLDLPRSQSDLAVFPCGRVIDGLELTVTGELAEVTLQGSPTADTPPSIHVIRPAGETADRNPVLLGTVYDPATVVTVNGLAPRRIGPWFWMNLDDADPDAEMQYHVELRALDTRGRTATLERGWYRWGLAPLTVDQASSLHYTREPVFEITGTTVDRRYSVELGDTPIPTSGNAFSASVPVAVGFNSIVVAARNRATGIVEAVRLVQVIRQDATIGIEVTSPVPGSIIAATAATISGRLSGAVAPATVSVNGVRALVTGSTFSTLEPLRLAEGENALRISVRDGSGRETSGVFHLTVDTIPPAISFVQPAEGFLSAASAVSLVVRAADATPLTVEIDGSLAAGVDGMYRLTMSYADGTKNVAARAVDAAGNSATAVCGFTVDTTPPEPFQVVVEPEGWTEDTTPVLTFTATDATSGIARYEISVDAGPAVSAVSPFEIGPLGDGVHSIEVTALDRAGNTRTIGAAARIDTVAPPAPHSFRGIEGPDQVELDWEAPADDVTGYVIERTPAWAGGPVQVTGAGYVDAGLTTGTTYVYSIVAVDRAGHVSQEAVAESVVGIAVVQVDPREPGGTVEFQNVSLYYPTDGLPEGTTQIEVTTAVSEGIEQEAAFGLASPIYDFTVSVKDESGIHQVEGAEFTKEFIGVLKYDDSLLPEGFPERNVGLYYWDTTWSQWHLVDKFAVDVEQDLILFATSHFTLFSVQPTMIQDLSPQELRDVGYSPFKAQVTQVGVTVSTQGGSAMTEVTEFVLPGKAGFDFVLKRTYDAVTARCDSPGLTLNIALSFALKKILKDGKEVLDLVNNNTLGSILEGLGQGVLSQLKAKIDGIFRNCGDYAYSTGVGWRLGLPYIRSAGSRVLVRTPSGAFYPVNDMKLASEDYVLTTRTLVLENHEGEDFTVVVRQMLLPIDCTKVNANGHQVTLPVLSWIMLEADLVMKDGSTYSFDSLGRVTRHVDGTGTNTISFAYGGTLGYFLDTITDSMGRVLRFRYQDDGSLHIVPRIASITLEGDPQGRRVQYTYTDETIDGTASPGVPLLATATDAVDRTWSYGYDMTVMLEGEVSFKVNLLGLLVDLIPGARLLFGNIVPSTFTLSGRLSTELAYTLGSLEGPGVGYVRITSEAKSFVGFGLDITDYLFGFIPTAIEGTVEFPRQLYTSSVAEYTSRGGDLLKMTSYDYTFGYAGDHQIINTRTDVADGRTVTTHHYATVVKERSSYLTVVDYLTSLSTIMQPITYREKVPYEDWYSVATTGGVIIERADLTYDLGGRRSGTMQMLERSVTRNGDKSAPHFSTTTYRYDDWGNITLLKERLVDGTREVEKATTTEYFVKRLVGTHPNAVPEGSPYALPALSRARMDLPLKQSIVSSVPGGSGEAPSQDVYYEYDSLGRRMAVTAVIGGRPLETTYEYDSHSEVIRITSPAGIGETQVTRIDRDYTPASCYIVHTTRESVVLSEGADGVDLESIVWYDRFSGLKRFERDARGFVTGTAHDAIGRPTAVIKPADDDARYADPLQSGSFLIDNPATNIIYDDASFDVTVEGPRGQRAVYDFDQAGRLLAIEKVARRLDAEGAPLSADPQVQRTIVGYDGWGDITSIVDPNGRRTDYTYDAMGRLSGIVYPADSGIRPEKRIVFDYAANTETTTDERGYVSITYFDMVDRKIGTLTYPDHPGASGRSVRTSTSYDGMGRVALSVDELGGVTSTRYDERGNVVEVTSPSATFFEAGAERTYAPRLLTAYDDAGAKLAETLVTEVGELQVLYANNGIGLLLSMERPYTDHAGGVGTPAVARELYGYDENGNRTLVIDANDSNLPPSQRKGTVTAYSARGKALSETDRAGNRTTYAYDADDNVVLAVDPRGNDVAYSGTYRAELRYDDVNRLVTALIPSASGGSAAASVHFTYDPRGNLLERVDADGMVTAFTYSARNKPLTERRSDQTGVDAILTERTYDLSGLETENLVGGLYRTTMRYDGLGRIVRTELPSGSCEVFGYDDAGNRNRVEDGKGNVTTSIFDSYERLLVETDALGNRRRLSYDARGNLTRDIDANGNVRLLTYDELGRLFAEQRADGATALHAYDAVGNLVWSRDAAGIETKYSYTNAYLVEQVVKRDETREQVQHFSWDRAGNRMSASSGSVTSLYNLSVGDGYVSDPYGRVRALRMTVGGETFEATWSYDEAGRVTKVGYPSGRAQSYLYDGIGLLDEMEGWITAGSVTRDAAGKLLGYRLSNGVDIEQAWNDDGRLVRLGYLGAGEPGQLPSYSFGYDIAGDMTSKGRNTYAYDERRRLVAADEAYWPEERRNEEAGAAIEDYTGQGRLVRAGGEVDLVLDRASTSIGAELGVERDIVAVELHPSTSGHRLRARTIEVWAWRSDAYQKVNGVSVSVESDGTLRAMLEEPVVTSSIKLHCLYDERDRDDQARDVAEFRNTNPNLLVIVYRMRRQRQVYEYDAKGNRLGVTKTVWLDDSTSSTTTSRGAYWPSSDRVKSYDGWTYVYDAKGRLIEKGTEYTEGVGFATTNGKYARYEWDLFDRLEIVKRSDAGTEGVVESARYEYDADGMRVQKTAGSEVTRWVYGPDGNPVLERGATWTREFVYAESKLLGYWQTTGGETRKYYTLTDHLGSVVSTTDESDVEVSKRDYLAFGGGAGVAGDLAVPALYTGKEWDEEIGLYYFNARWYDPDLGRFISEDPIMDGPNWYAYVGNSPMTHTDPTGLGDAGMTVWQHDEDRISPQTKEAIASLHPRIRDEAREFVLAAQNEGIDLRLTEGNRSMERQDALFNKGRDETGTITDPSKVVTCARAGESSHNFALAIDAAIVTDGKRDWDFTSAAWTRVGELGENEGFVWGGKWPMTLDAPHFEKRFGLTLKDLQARYAARGKDEAFIQLPLVSGDAH